jgi:cysteine desulfurase
VAEPRSALVGYLDASATTPPAAEVLEAMAAAGTLGWANPSSLHGPGIAAADCLERSRQRLARQLGAGDARLILGSGGSEAIHAALLGAAARLEPGRLLISAVEHPATVAAASRLAARGWQVTELPVDDRGVVRLEDLEALLAPPTRLVSLIWGQSEVGALQPIAAVGERCRQAGVLLHVDAVQVVGHMPVVFSALPVDLLSCTAHKLEGPRGVGALLARADVDLEPLIGGGGQEGGLRGGTEPVVLAAGFAVALERAMARLAAHGGSDPIAPLRDRLLERLLAGGGVRLSGPDPADPDGRLPHHLSLLVSDDEGRPLSGRSLVRALWREGYAVSSGSACSSATAGGSGAGAASPVLLAMGHDEAEAASGLRLSLGSWTQPDDLAGFPAALQRARCRVADEGRQTAGRRP